MLIVGLYVLAHFRTTLLFYTGLLLFVSLLFLFFSFSLPTDLSKRVEPNQLNKVVLYFNESNSSQFFFHRTQVEFRIGPILIKCSSSEFNTIRLFSYLTMNRANSNLVQANKLNSIINSSNLVYEPNKLNLNWKLSSLTKSTKLELYISARLVYKLSQLSMRAIEIARVITWIVFGWKHILRW